MSVELAETVHLLACDKFADKAHRIAASRPKYCCDMLGVILLLPFLLPVFLLIAMAIYLDDPGPLLFRQARHGLGRKVFHIYKFRTMYADQNTSNFRQAMKNDPRTTRIGRLLRRSRLDELPQLLNVLCGDMSLVGPRPHAVEMDYELAVVIEGYWDRYLVKPGLTGLAQVNGCCGPIDSLTKAQRRLRLDRKYIDNWSIWSDMTLLAKTPFVIYRGSAV